MLTETTLTNLSDLEYSQLWLDYGVLTIDDLTKQIDDLKNGDDRNREHYRYKTFVNFINRQSSINNSIIQQIIELLKLDNNKRMPSSAAIELLKKNYLTNEQFDYVELFLKDFGDWTIKYIDKIKQARFNRSASST